MFLTKKKFIVIFSDGSLNYKSTLIKKSKKLDFSEKDFKNFFFYQKNYLSFFDKKKTNFKTRYLKN
jgi:hypothetical protein